MCVCFAFLGSAGEEKIIHAVSTHVLFVLFDILEINLIFYWKIDFISSYSFSFRYLWSTRGNKVDSKRLSKNLEALVIRSKNW